MDGAVGCVSLCPHVLILPMLGCVNPKRVKVPGGCCDQLVCQEETLVGKKLMKKHRKDSGESENNLAEGSKLSPGWRGASRSLPGEHTDSACCMRCKPMCRSLDRRSIKSCFCDSCSFQESPSGTCIAGRCAV